MDLACIYRTQQEDLYFCSPNIVEKIRYRFLENGMYWELYIAAALRSASSDFLYLKKKITQDQKDAIEDVVIKKVLSGIRFDKI